MKPGIYTDIDEKTYHASAGISKHGLDLVNQSPMHYKFYKHRESSALVFGGALHCLALEPDTFLDRYVPNTTYKDFRTKAAKEWRDSIINEGKQVISVADYDHICAIVDAIHGHPYASILLDPTQGKAEQSAYWIDASQELWTRDNPTYRLCRCRPDFVNDAHNLVIDLKTTQCAGASKFARDVVNYRYHVQAAFYLDGLRQCGLKVVDFKFIAVEKTPPYAIGIYELSLDDLDDARAMYQRDLQSYHMCMTDKHWPGYPEHIRTLTLPAYSKYVDYY